MQQGLEGMSGTVPVEHLPWSIVEEGLDVLDLAPRQGGEVGSIAGVGAPSLTRGQAPCSFFMLGA